MALTDFVDHLDAPAASSFSALTSSSFPSLTDFSVSATSEALKWADLEQNVGYQIVSTRTVNTQHGQPYDDGELTVICVVNWTENELDWKCTIRINCYSTDYLQIIYLIGENFVGEK